MQLLARAPRSRDGSPVRARGRLRRFGAVVASTAVAAAGLVAFAAPSATAAEQTTTTATFEWGISEQMQKATHIGPGTCNWFSAGATRSNATSYVPTSGNVSVVTNGATPTFANKCAGTEAGAATPLSQKVVWTGGTGTVDPATGAATLAFTGTLWVNFYSGLSPFFIKDPTISVDANGVGTLVAATAGGYKADRFDPTLPAVQIPDVSNVKVVDLGTVVSETATGFVTTPKYAGVLIDAPASNPQNTTNAWVGAFPQSWVDFHVTTGLAPFWYSSGDSFDPTKDPSDITVTFGTLTGGGDPEEPPAPEAGQQVITAEVPLEVDPGEFVWTIDADDKNVTLTEAQDKGTYLQSTGAIRPIKVTDGRIGGPTWSISGQVGDFSGGLDGKYLGWTPNVSAPGSGAAPGGQVLSGFTSGNGLKSASVLASAVSGHAGGTAVLGADLDLRIPQDTAAGTYTAILTITALS